MRLAAWSAVVVDLGTGSLSGGGDGEEEGEGEEESVHGCLPFSRTGGRLARPRTGAAPDVPVVTAGGIRCPDWISLRLENDLDLDSAPAGSKYCG